MMKKESPKSLLMRTRRIAALLLASLCALSCGPDDELVFAWPPTLAEPYPDLDLLDHRGELVQLSSFKGKILLIEPIGMT